MAKMEGKEETESLLPPSNSKSKSKSTSNPNSIKRKDEPAKGQLKQRERERERDNKHKHKQSESTLTVPESTGNKGVKGHDGKRSSDENDSNSKAHQSTQQQKQQPTQQPTQHRRRAVLYMTLAMATHFAGHEFARSPIMSMFTSSEMGFQSSAVLPLAVGFVSPFSILLLWLYTKMLHSKGPWFALIRSTLAGSSFLLFIGFALHFISIASTVYNTNRIDSQSHLNGLNNLNILNNLTIHHLLNLQSLSKYLLFAAFVFQSANVQFLYTQHWSFIGSVLTPEQIATSGSLIAGIGSLTSTFAAAYVSKLVKHIGLIGAECTAAFIIGMSSILANRAYRISRRHGFEPKHDAHTTSKDTLTKDTLAKDTSSSHKKENTSSTTSSSRSNKLCCSPKHENMIRTSMKLFQRVPVIGAMFCEVLVAQCLSSLLNFHFVTEVKNEILNDELRAGFTGKVSFHLFFLSSFFFQFLFNFKTQYSQPLVLCICQRCQWDITILYTSLHCQTNRGQMVMD